MFVGQAPLATARYGAISRMLEAERAYVDGRPGGGCMKQIGGRGGAVGDGWVRYTHSMILGALTIRPLSCLEQLPVMVLVAIPCEAKLWQHLGSTSGTSI